MVDPKNWKTCADLYLVRPAFFSDVVQVCHSFWVLSALAILNKVSWIDSDKLASFILSAQVCSHPQQL